VQSLFDYLSNVIALAKADNGIDAVSLFETLPA